MSALAIIAWLAVISYQNNQGTRDSMTWVAHTNRVLFHSEEILSLIIDLESGQRGYALTGRDEFLVPATEAIEKVRTHVNSLGVLIGNNKTQQERAARLQLLVNEKIQFTKNAINARKTLGLENARELNATLRGKELTDEIRTLINELQSEEKDLLIERTAIAQGRNARFNNYFMAMLVVTGSILILLFYAIYLNTRAREKAQQSLKIASRRIEDIYNNAPCGYHSLNSEGVIVEINQTFLDWLQYTREELVGKVYFRDLLTPESREIHGGLFDKFKQEGIARNLEFEAVRKDGSSFVILINASAQYDSQRRFVQSRSTVLDYTEQRKAYQRIAQLNQELESFSYSVSHDLRAPLRSIHGYTQILTEDYAGKLDDEGRRLLQVVVNNARRMARLIDDLLDFSRISRKDIASSKVNTEAMVQSVLNELLPAEQGRDIDIRMQPLESCEADPNLLRQVWFNLLANALKYTRKKQQAVIEISSEAGPTEIVYRVKDNGTGFDMLYVGKLFGVFQRLHRQNEFEGTGVGLAIVQRIVTRHGGTVWGTGEVDKGADFCFSLPRNPVTNG